MSLTHAYGPADERESIATLHAAIDAGAALIDTADIYGDGANEELGLHEVGDIPDAERQDPSFFRNPGVDVGRDGCRVPIPWTRTGESFGFGDGGSHLPQPAWFADSSVEAEDADPDSTLNLYRKALGLRGQLQSEEHLEWLETGRDDVLAFRRPNGWTSVTVFGDEPYALPAGELLLASAPVADGALSGVGTAWLRS